MSESSPDAPPSRPWSVEGFALFWSHGRDARMVAPVVWPDVVGKWPGASAPVVGRVAYIGAIANFLTALGDFSVEVTDHASNGDVAFVRWIVHGDFPVGPDHIVGVDRLVLKNGYVIENHIHSDHPIFAELAKTHALG
ncbi:nuclear transport factor 2 family protein [Sphingopyxis sp.]|jgi:hypothetical protein|uniref:nuclear transport factor 2 family protein n=1 Tax=Sphingopyxis sp. TaxID=1908224 RepID=UPI003F7156E7